nr:prostaglandin E2 receptor EP4 subtype-like [Biomphalaria glabrata]
MPGGHHLCKFNGFAMVCFGLSTPLIVSAMAIERFLFVKYTFFYTKHCAPGAARLVILCIWGFVLFFGLLPMFGFGDYVLQYPQTWCFMNFRTTDPVLASYGYIYSCLNLLLVMVMVVCNLVVVVTLARVRDYRRKHSTCSTNAVISADAGVDDQYRQQAIARRRKQKDIELQMIVVMCAITTIFAVCWVPLMVHISMTLAMASSGTANHVLGLVAIRLASINQTLNPWLYVILRRTLIVKVKKFFCRWKRYLRKRPNISQLPVGRRQQYVHVRHQLCHRNNFVGGNIEESMSDSLRKSIQQAIPAAMSLPDVMMVNTGRRELSMMLPDVAKAQSYGGRVSHSYSAGNVSSCVVCQAQAVVFCRDCYLEKLGLKEQTPDRESSDCHGKHCPDQENNKSEDRNSKNSKCIDYLRCLQGDGALCSNCQPALCENHEHLENGRCAHDVDLMPSKDSKEKNCERFELNSSFNRKRIQDACNESSSLLGRSGVFRLSQHRHPPREPLKSTASVKSTKSPNHNDRSGRHPSAASGEWVLGTDEIKKRDRVLSNPHDHADVHPEEMDEYDDVFDETYDMLDKRKYSTTDDNCFSSMPTESVCVSESVNTCKYTRTKQNVPTSSSTRTHDVPVRPSSELRHNDPQTNAQSAHTNNVPTTSGDRKNRKQTEPRGANSAASQRNEAFDGSSSRSSSSALDDEGSSGIFSAESPVRNSKEIPKPKWLKKKESQSELLPDELAAVKQPARRVKSYN